MMKFKLIKIPAKYLGVEFRNHGKDYIVKDFNKEINLYSLYMIGAKESTDFIYTLDEIERCLKMDNKL